MIVQVAVFIRRWQWSAEPGEQGRTWTRVAAQRAYERAEKKRREEKRVAGQIQSA